MLMSAGLAAQSDHVEYALDRLPSTTESSTPQARNRHLRCPSVSMDAPALPTCAHLFQGRHLSPYKGPRRRP